MSQQSELDRLLQTEWREKIIPNLGNSEWITVYQTLKVGDSERLDRYSGLVPNDRIAMSMSNEDWEIREGSGLPCFQWETDVETGLRLPEYDRYGWPSNKVEPLVIVRSFYGLEQKAIEVSEEFRHFLNLYSSSRDTIHCKLDATGESIPVVRIQTDRIDIRRKELRQFLAVKNMALTLYFDRMQFSPYRLADWNMEETSELYATDNSIYRFNTLSYRWQASKMYQSLSRTWGKALLHGIPIDRIGQSPHYDSLDGQYEQFRIRLDINEEPIVFTCDPSRLANYFGRNPGAPHFLTPVFFRRSVIDKYVRQPSKYHVGDGILQCGDLWHLRIDNNHPEHVIVFLGDLGERLPFREQSHWKHHNVVSHGGLSDTSSRRWLQQEGAPASDSALRFQHSFKLLVNAWHQHFGWHLFKPLSEADFHHFRALRRPLSSEPSEFHEIMLSLSILLQDRIAMKDIGKCISEFQPKDENGRRKGSISVLGEYLESEGFADATRYVEYLRMLQMLRSNSGTVHPRNEKEYKKAERFFALDSKSTIQVADDIFTTLTDFLDSLRAHFCPDDTA